MYNETNVLTKMEDVASLRGDAVYYQWEEGVLKESLEICYLICSVL